MKIFLIHNTYQHAGGEDVVFKQERDLLERAGHQVLTYCRSNSEIANYSTLKRLRLMGGTVWGRDSYREVKALLENEAPDIAHFHNTFPLISPSVYYACRARRVPVVQTLHNYRLLCPAATLSRQGRVCEACIEHSLWQAIPNRCYRQSSLATATLSLMLGAHRWLGTWTAMVDCYIALTESARKKFIEGGLPPEKIVVKPNFVCPDPSPDGGSRLPRAKYALFVGRLSEEKGMHTLIAAWARLNGQIPLVIVGDGPLITRLKAEASLFSPGNVTFRGHLTRPDMFQAVKGARFLILPSQCYENFPMSAVEAFSCGVPVICSRLGAMQEIVADGRTGLHFTPGDANDLAPKVEWAWDHPQEMAVMGRAARAEYEARYTAERNCALLMEIYKRAIKSHQATARSSPKISVPA